MTIRIAVITVQFGPWDKDGCSVWKRKFYSGRHPISTTTWDVGA